MAGAIGVTCAKLGEAEIMAAGGIGGILVANQIVGPRKVERLVDLARRTDIIVTIDCIGNARAISAAAAAAGVRVGVVIEVDVGMRRAGVAAGAPAVALAQEVARLEGVRFRGFEAWEGHASYITEPDAKRDAVRAAVGLITGTADRARSEGLAVE